MAIKIAGNRVLDYDVLSYSNTNIAVGYQTLQSLTTGTNNSAVGNSALYDLTTATNNTVIGYNTGRGITTGSKNTIIGANVTGLSATLANTIILADGDGNKRIYVDSSGNVGIGTTSLPASKLTIYDSNKVIDSIGNFSVFTTNSQAADLGGSIGLGGANGSASAFDPWAFAAIKGAKENSTSSNFAGYLAFATASSGGTIAERMRIDSSGKLLIGTTTASTNSLLTIVGGGIKIGNTNNTDATLHISTSYGGFDRLTQIHPTGASKPALNLMASNDASSNNQWWVWGIDANVWKIHSGTSFSATPAFSITSGSFVGINTTTAATYLDISHPGNATFGVAARLNQTAVGNSDGPKIEFRKTMTSTKSWAVGILNGVDVGTFTISEDAGTGGFGTSRLSISAGGNVNIGSLGVAIDSSKNFYPGNQTTNFFGWDGSGIYKSGSGYFYLSAGTFYVQSNSVFRGVVSNDSATYLQINGGTSGHTYFNGNVGIFKSSPKAKLDVSNYVIHQYTYTSKAFTGGSWYRFITFDGTNAGDEVRIILRNPGGHDSVEITFSKHTVGNSNLGYVAEVKRKGTYAYTHNITKIRVCDNGVNAATSLEVQFGANHTNTMEMSMEGYCSQAFTINDMTAGATGSSTTKELFVSDGVSGTNNQTVHGYSLASGDLFYILGNGNVGIGTSSPGFKLDVSGTGSFNSVAIGRGGGGILDNMAVGYLALSSNTTNAANTALGPYALQYNTGYDNTAVGYLALRNNTTGVVNTALGAYALENNSTASENIAIGGQTLRANTTGYRNTAVGFLTLRNNTTGYENTAVGWYSMVNNTAGYFNVAVGRYALQGNTTAYSNTAVGFNAMLYNTTGVVNTAMGESALANNTTANHNVAIGYLASLGNTTGYDNTSLGSQALQSNTTGRGNVAVGRLALISNTTGIENTVVGALSLYYNTTGYSNSAMGYVALHNNTTGYANNAFGYGAMFVNTTGYYNTSMGHEALRGNTTGYGNSAFGFRAMYLHTTGYYNTAVGYESLYYNTTGYQNSAFGLFALLSNTTGYSNSAFGCDSLRSNTTGYQNVAVGVNCLYKNTTGYQNIGTGYYALFNVTTGAQNIGIGVSAGEDVTTGIGNTLVGFNTGRGITTGNYNTIIGNSVTGLSSSLSNTIIISDGQGNRRIYVNSGGEVLVGGTTDNGAYNLQCNGTAVWGAGAYVNGSDFRLKTNIKSLDSGLDVVKVVRPVTFQYKPEYNKDENIQTGFIAQELLEALKDKEYVDGIVQKGHEYLSVAYQNFIPILVKAIQELTTRVEELENK